MSIRSSTSIAVLLSAAGLALASPGVHPDGDAGFTSTVQPARGAMQRIGTLPGPVGYGARGDAPSPVFVMTGSDPEGDAPSDVVFTPDGATIIVAHRESGNLILWDAATRAFVGSVEVSGLAQSVDVTPDGSTAVVACLDTGLASIVDLNTLTEVATVPVGQAPGSVAISPDGARAAVHAAFDGAVAIINIAGASVERVIPGIDTWQRSSFSFEPPAQSVQYGGPVFIDATRLINVDLGADEVQFINAATGAVNRVPVADNPFRVGLSLDGTTAAVAHSGTSRRITVFDLATESVRTTWNTSFDLSGPIAVNADGTKAAVAVQNAARVFDLTNGSFSFELNTASNNDLVPNFDGTRAVGIGFRGPVIDFASGFLLANANQAVSCEIGAASPVDDRTAMCSTTFGDDLVVIDTDSSPSLEAFQLSGPAVEGDRCRTIGVSADGSVAVGVSIFSDTASIIDTATGTIIGTAPVGQRPNGVAITPDGTKAVVANLDSTFASVIDLATATTTNIPISRRAGEVAISPDGRYAYLPVVADGDGVWRIDLDTLTVAGPKILTGNMGGVGYSYGQNSGIALSADGAKLAVAGSFDDVVSIIDTASWTLERNIPTGDFPAIVAFSADGTRLFVSVKNEDQVEIIAMDQPVPAVVAQVNAGDQPWHLVPDLANNRLYVNAWGDTRINLIDLSFPVLAGGVALADRAVGLVMDADGTLWAADGSSATTLGGASGFQRTESGRLTQLDPATLGTIDQWTFDAAPSALAGSAGVFAMAAPTGDGVVLADFRAGGCNPADLAEPFGVLDLGDIQAFVGGFLAQDPIADLAPPSGVFDLDDIQVFVGSFSSGCP